MPLTAEEERELAQLENTFGQSVQPVPAVKPELTVAEQQELNDLELELDLPELPPEQMTKGRVIGDERFVTSSEQRLKDRGFYEVHGAR